jgi:hypothetical protein
MIFQTGLKYQKRVRCDDVFLVLKKHSLTVLLELKEAAVLRYDFNQYNIDQFEAFLYVREPTTYFKAKCICKVSLFSGILTATLEFDGHEIATAQIEDWDKAQDTSRSLESGRRVSLNSATSKKLANSSLQTSSSSGKGHQGQASDTATSKLKRNASSVNHHRVSSITQGQSFRDRPTSQNSTASAREFFYKEAFSPQNPISSAEVKKTNRFPLIFREREKELLRAQQEDARREKERLWLEQERQKRMEEEDARALEAAREESRIEYEKQQQRIQKENTIKAQEKARKVEEEKKARDVTPEKLRELRELIRLRYELDNTIWTLRGVRVPDRYIVEAKIIKADAALKAIEEKIEIWEDTSRDIWTDVEWAKFEQVRDRIRLPGKRLWKTKAPFGED